MIIAVLSPIILAAVGYITVRALNLTELAIREKFTGALPYLVAVVTPAWAALTTVIGFYFNKAKAENKAKIEKSENATKRDA